MGSDTSTANGKILASDGTYSLLKAANRRTKRLIDVVTALFFLVSFPVHFFTVKKPGFFFKNCFNVLVGKRTWVGYIVPSSSLPKLRKGILGSNGLINNGQEALPKDSLKMVDRWYAKEYEPLQD
ncbi:MAG TPA: hypothetical protein VEV15_04545, partial [Flavisolibacter sp.]|nr:hypothetical protein [Flavisolibacter sp.]